MARMLTEEEVEKLEKQRELQSRAQAATDPNALYNQRMAAAHEAAMQRRRGYVESNPNAETNVKFRNQVLREQELGAARAHELQTQGEELSTRQYEAEQKRLGMENQGVGAAKLNSEAAIRAAELQAASAEKIAVINKDRDLGVAKWNYKGKKDEGDAKVEAAGLQADATVKAAETQAQAQEKRLYAENMMRQRNVDEKTAQQFAEQRSKMINDLIKSRTNKLGKPTMTEEEAARIVDERLKGSLPGTERRPLASFGA